MDRQRPLDFNYHHHHNYNPPPPSYPNHYPHHNNFTPPPPPNFADPHHHNPYHQNYNQPPPPNYYNHPPPGPPPPPPPGPPPPYYGDSYHYDNHYYNDYNQQPNHGPYPNQFNNQNSYGPPPPNFDSGYFMNGEPHGGFGGGGGRGGGGGFHMAGRKRGHDRDVRGASQGHPGGPTNAKLYLAPVPCTKTEEDLRTLFREHGTVVEVIMPKDKWIDPQQGYCFVKYAKLEEADRAIMALNNQYTFAELGIPIKVKYADGDRDCIAKPERELAVGTFLDKLYVGCLSKLATKREIEEIFSPYGYVEDVYIAVDHLRQSRGYAFVKYTCRDMALAAIKALHGIFTMRGCEQPLVVRFADPKKPRTGEFRPAHNFGDFHGGPVGNDAFEPMKVNSVNAQEIVHRNCEPGADYRTEESRPLVDQPPSNLPQAASQKEITETENQKPNLEQQQGTKFSLAESEQNGKNPQEASVPSTASDVPSDSNVLNLDPEECDWSEHTCPDGYKYYYNCETYESRWDKPEEFAAFQQRLLERQKTSQKSNEKVDAVSPNNNGDDSELPKQERDNVRILSETSQVVFGN